MHTDSTHGSFSWVQQGQDVTTFTSHSVSVPHTCQGSDLQCQEVRAQACMLTGSHHSKITTKISKCISTPAWPTHRLQTPDVIDMQCFLQAYKCASTCQLLLTVESEAQAHDAYSEAAGASCCCCAASPIHICV